MSAGLIIGAFFIGIAAILVLITLHELGHFIIAKIAGAYVYEFSIGYGPRLYTHKGKETWFSIRLFPLGGYCEIASDRNEPPKGREEDYENIPDSRKMDYIARWKKALFIIAGPVMNFAIAIIMISIILMATLRLPQDMSFYGNKLDETKIAYNLVKEDLKNNPDAIKYDKDIVNKFAKNTQIVSITGWEVVNVKDGTKMPDKDVSTIKLWEGSNSEDSVVKLIYSNLLNDKWTDQWNDDNIKQFTHFIKDTNGFQKFSWILDNPIKSSNVALAPDYSTIVYNFLDNFDSEKMIGENGYHSYIRLSYRIMNNDLSTGKYINDAKDYVTDFSAKDKFIANKKDTTKVGINAPSRYFANTTKAYAYSWKVMGQDSLSILKAFALLFTGHINALAGPVGVASQTADLITQPETFFLYVAGLSANLFVLNLIPVPPLDGYKFFENAVEACLRREVKQKTKMWLYGIGIAVFILIFVIVTIKDFVIG